MRFLNCDRRTMHAKLPTRVVDGRAFSGLSSEIDLDHPSLYSNRELSWLKFNDRVLAQATDTATPLLERVKFASIFASNLDEFFMIRVSGLRQQLQAGVVATPPDGMMPSEQLAAVRRALAPSLERHIGIWRTLEQELVAQGIRLLAYGELREKQQKLVRRYFREEIFPTLTPLALDPSQPFPHVSNLSMNLAILVQDADGVEHFARLKVPGFFPRLLPVPSEESADDAGALGLAPDDGEYSFVWMEDIVAANLERLFPGHEIAAAYPFRVTRAADQEIELDEAGDLLSSIEQGLRLRQFGTAVRLEITDEAPARLREVLIKNLGIAPFQVYSVSDRLGLSEVIELIDLDRSDLKEPPFSPFTPAVLQPDGDIFAAIAKRDVMLYHPYDSFDPVIDFVRAAAEDPDVLAIKQTLYRVGQDSPLVDALARARANGKQVAALVELRARFDEANNIVWARALEDAGVHVVYGVVGFKTHAKLCLVVRREEGGIVHYLHASTGNYNATTARLYTDIGLFTADPKICAEAAGLFNALTGYARGTDYTELVVAPDGMREGVLSRIEREIESHRRDGAGHLAMKMNSLVDAKCIKSLYRASQAGVRVDLQVRGICCLRPGVEGVSDNIRVTSIVGRFLEHARVYYFHNGGDEELLIGSADFMPRNFDSRVEVLVPVQDAKMRHAIKQRILAVHLSDNVNARRLMADGEYARLDGPAADRLDSQRWMIEHRGTWTSQ